MTSTSLVLTQMLAQVVSFAVSFFAGLFVLRYLMQWVRAPFRNPIGRFVMTLTDWGVLPLRRVVPGWRGNDLSSLVMAWLIESVGLILMLMLIGGIAAADASLVPLCLAAGFIEMLRLVAYVILGATIGVVVLSWVNPHAPLAPLFDALSAPFLQPFQRMVPLIGGIDLSPLFLLLVLQILLGVLASFKMALLGMPL
jgi:YggT family protein